MLPVFTDRVARSFGLSVGLSVTVVSPAKAAEPVEMPVGLSARVGSRSHLLDGGPDPPWDGAVLEERVGPL